MDHVPSARSFGHCTARSRLSRRDLGELTGVSHSVIWYWEVGRRQGLYDIRQLLHFADAVQMPRKALLPVILGQPCGLGELLADSVSAAPPMAGAAGRRSRRRRGWRPSGGDDRTVVSGQLALVRRTGGTSDRGTR